jgi:hypothetical protein
MRVPRSVAWLLGFALSTSVVHSPSRGANQAAPETASTQPPPVQLTAEQDHQRMRDLMHITSLRRGAGGDPRRWMD